LLDRIFDLILKSTLEKSAYFNEIKAFRPLHIKKISWVHGLAGNFLDITQINKHVVFLLLSFLKHPCPPSLADLHSISKAVFQSITTSIHVHACTLNNK